MNTSLLLVSTATQWFGTARIPRELANAGFTVALLTPRGSLAATSRYLARTEYLSDQATPMQWVLAFAAIVEASSPRLVVPCDDTAFRLLQDLVLSRPSAMQPTLHLQLSALIRDSLGDPAWYRTSVDKALLLPAASALGIRVPPYAVVSSLPEAASFAAVHGYPIVLKRGTSFAGQGVAIVSRRDELGRAFAHLTTASAEDVAGGPAALLVQAHIPGHAQYYALAAWRGSLLAGWAADKRVTHPEPTGPSTVVRCHRGPEARDFAERLVRGFGMTGILSVDCMIHEGTGQAYLLEINRRVNPGSHCGRRFRVDLCAALYASLHGAPPTSRAELGADEEHIVVLFPQEWLRDCESPYLRRHPVDVPWDDPGLMAALVALRRE